MTDADDVGCGAFQAKVVNELKDIEAVVSPADWNVFASVSM